MKSLRKEQADMYDGLKLSYVDVDQVVSAIFKLYRKITEANTDDFLRKLFNDYLDNSEDMQQIMPSMLPDYVTERHLLVKTLDNKIAIEFNYIEDRLANCRINVVCKDPHTLEQSLSKKFSDFGDNTNDPRLSQYSFYRINNEEDILYGSYTNKAYRDMLYIHLTAMEYSGL